MVNEKPPSTRAAADGRRRRVEDGNEGEERHGVMWDNCAKRTDRVIPMIEHAAGRSEPKSSLFSESSDILYTLMKVTGVSERNPG